MFAERVPRGRVVALIGLVLVALVLAGFLLLGGNDSHTPAASTAKASPTPSATPAVKPTALPTTVSTKAPQLSAPEKTASAKATSRLTDFLDKSATALGNNNGKADLASLAAGPALGEIQALAQQYKFEDMTVSGTPKALGSRVVSANLGAKPASVTLAVCLDNRPVVVRDAKGRNLVKHRSRAEQIVLNLYELQEVKNSWLVVNHSIPANSSCKRIGISS